jgi:hypothetical protein
VTGAFDLLIMRQPEALDEIITSLMENGNSTRPAAASQDVIEQLPREVLEVGCMLMLSQFPSLPG